jgi:hypothetical protein
MVNFVIKYFPVYGTQEFISMLTEEDCYTAFWAISI